LTKSAAIPEESSVPVKEKKKKAAKVVEPLPEEPEKKKKQKKQVPEPEPEVVETVVKSKKHKKKKTEDAIVEETAEVPEKKKSKKRKIAEADEMFDADVPKPKKLNILKQIEDPYQFNAPREENKKPKEIEFSIPLPSKKLKQMIPQEQVVEKKRKKKTERKVIPEPRRSLPKPVWTTAGIFIEQPRSPFKFTTSKYVPINAGDSSTQFGVVAFEGKKKKNQNGQSAPVDFKTQAIMRNKKNRDGSMKNMRGLLSGQRTF
jgi:hypothetical protein